MNVLPRLMFSFQASPIITKPSILEVWESTIGKFVWAWKKPQIKLKCLCDLKDNGGLQLPNVKI